MRTIKFRAWDECFNKIRSWKYLKDYSIEAVFDPKNEFRLMQFTGLKDKNGKEIWEGDIVDGRRYYRPKLYGKREVKWDFYSLHDLSSWCSRKEVEVIGNIYENPELLK